MIYEMTMYICTMDAISTEGDEMVAKGKRANSNQSVSRIGPKSARSCDQPNTASRISSYLAIVCPTKLVKTKAHGTIELRSPLLMQGSSGK